MDQRATYLVQILEAIGAPLMSAISQSGAQDADNPQADAQAMAALLAKTVEASIELGNIMDINPAEAQDDTLRVALAGLAGPLVAGQYAARSRMPESPELKKITSALQAVLTFSDNFTPTPDTVERLKNLQASGQVVDTYQTQIQYMQAFIPVIEVVAAFPFGQAEAKLIMDVSDRLVKRAVELRETLLPGVGDEATQKRAELALLRALALLYSACHRAETEKVTGMDADAQTTALSIDPVWKAFDIRAAMLEALAAKMVPANPGSGQAGGNKAPDVQAAPVEAVAPPVAPAAPPETAPAATPPPQTPPPQPVEPPPAPPTTEAPPPPVQPQNPDTAQGQGNPMAMFAKPKTEEAQTPPPAPPQDTPVAPPPAAPTESPPQAPVTPPPAEDSGEQQGEQQGGQQGQGGSPMSFFKKDE